MNIFVLHQDPETASMMHVDKHVVKMPLESAQILCTVHWELGNTAPYKSTHRKHPCSTWAMESIKNYEWLCSLGMHLCREYTFRYGKTHKSQAVIEWCMINKPALPDVNMTSQYCAMPDEYKTSLDPVQCYRNYYIGAKSHIHTWKNRQKPYWIN
jgi:hypothetical protein